MAKIYQIWFRPGSAADPTREAYSAASV